MIGITCFYNKYEYTSLFVPTVNNMLTLERECRYILTRGYIQLFINIQKKKSKITIFLA